MKIEIQGSAAEPYVVDTEKLSCTCPDYLFRCSHYPATSQKHYCKHMLQAFEQHPEMAPLWYQKQRTEADYAIEQLQNPDPDGKKRYPLSFFDIYVYDLKAVLAHFTHIIERYEFCGSYRRKAARVSDLDLLIQLKPGGKLSELFDYLEGTMGYELITNIGRGEKKGAYMIDGMVHIDFKAVPEESWPFATLHFTGSKAHNIKMRQRALALGYSLSEYGFKDADGVVSSQGCKTEADIFKFLRIPYKEPWDRTE